MGIVKEPDGVYFVIQSKPLTKKMEEELSIYITKRKRQIKRKYKKQVKK